MSATPQSLGIKTVAAAGTPVALIAASTQTKEFVVTPIKSAAPRVANTGPVYLMANGGTRATAFAVIQPTDPPFRVPRERGSGGFFDLSQWFVDADTTGDGVLVGYLGE